MTTNTVPAYGIDVPDWTEGDPASLEAFFGNYGMWEHFRKVVQANCEELVRAKYESDGQKITETRIQALGRLHPNYIQFLTDGLFGRQAREQNVRDSLRNGA
jgi:hypothetical protein